MTKMKGDAANGDEHTSSSLLPLAPRTLCFDKNEFMNTDFSVDNFVADCRRKVRLETLRQDLEIYFKLLKNAMIELINKDYADFVNLSTNLVGLDKAIGQLRHPLKSIKEDVTNVETSINHKVMEVETAFADQRKLMEKRKLLGHMLGLLKAADKIEHIQRSEDAKNGQALERIAGEFNQLQHHATFCRGLPVLTQIRQRVAEITGKLQCSLESELVQGLNEGDTKKVHRCLNSYALISKTHDAENLVQIHIVEPYLKQIFQEHRELSSPEELPKLFQLILELVPTHLKLLCDVTSGRKNRSGEQYRGIPGYDFVVNSAWPQIVASFENDMPELFSSRDPNAFHQRYLATMEFVSSFERQCGSQASIAKLRQSEAYNALMTHWSLPVYFQIRLQEIGGKIEAALVHPSKESNVDDAKYRLQSTAVLKQCLESCWNSNIFLPAILHRFWKLTLQLISRFSTWVKQVHKYQITSSSPPKDFTPLSLNQMTNLIVDIDQLLIDVQVMFDDVMKPRALNHGLKDPSILQSALDEPLDLLRKHRKDFVDHIVNSLTAAAIPHLKQSQDVPRLFRKTNRPAPTEPSAYLALVINPALSFREESSHVDSHMLSQWLTEFAVVVSDKYYLTVCDVLNSVKKMEESMMRLQKLRSGKFSSGNLSSLASTNDSLSDDDKIRLQLYLDVVSFGKQMTDCDVKMESIEKFCLLLQTVKEAKEKPSLS